MSGALQQLQKLLASLARRGSAYELDAAEQVADELRALARRPLKGERVLFHGQMLTSPDQVPWELPDPALRWWGTPDPSYAIDMARRDILTGGRGALHVLGVPAKEDLVYKMGRAHRMYDPDPSDFYRGAEDDHLWPDITKFVYPRDMYRPPEWLVSPKVPIRRYRAGGVA